ncbi:unnamed protein product, partial [Tetraodon nigroviridis]
PDLLNFKKGWMSKLDDNGELNLPPSLQWKKHWFVLSDAGLKYYRDSSAEEVNSAVTLTLSSQPSTSFENEKDDLDGEIDLKSCVKVSEFDVEKNYGFQIQVRVRWCRRSSTGENTLTSPSPCVNPSCDPGVWQPPASVHSSPSRIFTLVSLLSFVRQTREATFTLSAMTAGIRRNWIEVLKKSIRPSSSPDLTQLPDSSSDKENSLSRAGLPLHRPVSHRASVQSDPPASAPPTHRRFDYVELSPVPASAAPLSANQREAGEGQGREHSQWQEERTSSSQWEALLSRKGSGAGSNRVEEEIEKKWAEFETLPLRDMSSRPTLGSWASKQSANEALQREVVCGEVFPICIER